MSASAVPSASAAPSRSVSAGQPVGNQASQRAAVLALAQHRDRIGHNVHVGAGMLYLFGLAFSSNAAAIGFCVLAFVTVFRLRSTIQTYRYLFNDWVGWLFIAWAAMSGLTILWSPDQMQGLDEWRAFRAIFTAIMLWPVVHYAPWFIAGFLLAVFAQNLVQLGQAVGLVELHFGDAPRLRGMTHPVITGTLCVMAMCWHLSAIMLGRKWWRWLSVMGFLAAGIGLVATGSRGPWIAGAIAVPACVIGIAWRWPGARKMAFVAMVAAAVIAIAAWPFVRGIVEYRLERTQEDIALVEQGKVQQNLGLSYRLACWEAAWEIFGERPLGGIGAGGYLQAARETSRGDVLTNVHHAHSVYMHVLANTGVLGGIALLAVVAAALRRAWRDRWDHPYAAGSFFALLAWLIAGCFDSIHLNGPLLGVFAAILTLTLPTRPGVDHNQAPVEVGSP